MQLLLDICHHLTLLQPLLTIGSTFVGAANLAVGVIRMRRTR
ncbi:hypothetical protein ACFU9F_33605 [Streptomyces zhihengii]